MSLYTSFGKRTAAYYWVQAGHRSGAVEAGSRTLRDAAASESARIDHPAVSEFARMHGEWVADTLIQGAYLREYHSWEKDTKQYLADQLRWNDRDGASWLDTRGSHVTKVRGALASIQVTIPEAVGGEIDRMRERVNRIKHEPGWSDADFVTREEFDVGMRGVMSFWNDLASQETFRFGLEGGDL